MEGKLIKALIAVLLCILFVFGMYFFSPYYSDKQITQVTASLPTKTGITDYVILRGTLVEQERQNIYCSGPAQIDAVYVQVGDAVKKGQPLMEVTTLAAGEQSSDILYDEVYGAIAQASPEQILDGSAGFSDDLAAIVSSAVGGIRIPSNTAPQTEVLYSPIDGVVMQLGGEEGREVSGILPCAVVSDFDQLAVKAQVSEASVSRVQEGMDCVVTVNALTGEKALSGSISSIMPYGQKTSTLVQSGEVKTDVYVDISNADGQLKPGYSAQAKVAVGRKNDALVIPYTCISQDETQHEYVMAVEEGRAVKKYITVGYEMENSVEVLSGVEEDTLLISDPESVRHGERVTARLENS